MSKHIFVPDTYRQKQDYHPPRRMVAWAPPKRDRLSHGNYLRNRLNQIWADTEEIDPNRTAIGIPHPEGLHISIRLHEGSEQQIKKLERLPSSLTSIGIRIHSARTCIIDEKKIITVVIWIPRDHRAKFAKKIEDYLIDTPSGKPKNNDLVACIDDIRKSILEDFWPRHEVDRIPGENPDWVEVWLACDRTEELNETIAAQFQSIAEKLGIRVQDRKLVFPERRVVLAYATRQQLHALIESCDEVAELRLARECASFLIREPDAGQWVMNLVHRTIPPPVGSPAVCVFDTGVNAGHPLLRPVCDPVDCLTVVDSWGVTDHDRNGHGTSIGGLCAYGPLEPLIGSSATIYLTHRIESVKLIAPENHPESLPKDLWGAYTLRAAAEIEARQPQRLRSFCMTITSTEDRDRGKPSSWSGAVDQLTSGFFDGIRKLMFLPTGNIIDDDDWLAYPDNNQTAGIEDPGQAWNALTVGAYTDKIDFDDRDGTRTGYQPIAEAGDLSPYSTTSLNDWDTAWPIKPEIVCEGGNLLKSPDGRMIGSHPDLDVLTISKDATHAPLTTMWATSGATAQAAWRAGQIQAAYPHAWPETIRAMMVHSARWTETMLRNRRPNQTKDGYRQLLQTVGYGVPDLKKALESGKNSLTLIAQQEIQPFGKNERGSDKSKDMHIFSMPWPTEVLQELPPETLLSVRVTLSYFIEPSPQEIGWKDRYRYSSFGLRWDMIRPQEPLDVFIARISRAMADDEESSGIEDETDSQGSPDKRWTIGIKKRERGSLHVDMWLKATAADVAACPHIAVYPVIGWWRKRKNLGKLEKKARYSLVVGIESPDINVDIYTSVATKVGIPITPTISV